MKDKVRLQFIRDLDHSSLETQKVRLFWCDKFLKFAPDDFNKWNKELVSDFQRQLESEKYAGLSIRFALGVVKRVFDAARTVYEDERLKLLSQVNPEDPKAVAEILRAISLPGPRWDVGKRALPKVDSSEIVRPALTFDDMKKIVETARAGNLGVREVAYVALASVYGLRRGELASVRKEDIDFTRGVIFVRTEKGGEQREQLLAEQIIPYLKGYDFEPVSAFEMSIMFKKICYKSGVDIVDGGGWHMWRRGLETLLRDALATDHNLNMDSRLVTKIFFRWRLVSSPDMTDRYYTVDPLVCDRVALAHHPVLPLWS